MTAPQADLRVVDCATVLAGAGCGRHLADAGRPLGVDTEQVLDALRGGGWPARSPD